jgi:hypothetical protein
MIPVDDDGGGVPAVVPPVGTLPELLARAGWLTVSTSLMTGIVHDLNGRVTSLAGLVQLLSIDDTGGIAPFLEEEVRRLDGSVRLMGLLAGETGGERELVALDRLLGPLVDLHRRRPGLEGVEIDLEFGDVPPILADARLLAQTVLLVFAAAGQGALARGRRVDVFAGTHARGGALLRASAPGPRDGPVRPPQGAAPSEALHQLARRLPAKLRRDEAADGLRMSLHFAPAARGRAR